MALKIQGRKYYRTSEACEMAGISKATFFRWLKDGILPEVGRKDRNGWRLFTQEDIKRIKAEVARTNGS